MCSGRTSRWCMATSRRRRSTPGSSATGATACAAARRWEKQREGAPAGHHASCGRWSTSPDYTIVECRLETGRTHQIRIHLSELGHLLCGEKTYTHPLGGKAIEDTSGAPRHALHAAELAFIHPMTNQPLRFQHAAAEGPARVAGETAGPQE